MFILDKMKAIVEGIYFITFWKIASPEKRKIRMGVDKRDYYNSINQIEMEIMNKYLNDSKSDKNGIAKYIKRHGLTEVFPYEFCDKYFLIAAFSLAWDKHNQFYYMRRKGKKIYLKQNNYRQALYYCRSLLMEQDKKSPHKYVENEKRVGGEILFDCGAAEGIFSIDNVENFKHIYVFEADYSWIKALQLSFKPYAGKVTIVNRYLSDHTDEMSTTLDEFAEKEKINPNGSIFVKIDVEGAEEEVLKGTEKLLKESTDLNMAVCTYHKENDGNSLYKQLKSYEGIKLEFTKGYMILFYDKDISTHIPEAYFRKGILRAEKRKG